MSLSAALAAEKATRILDFSQYSLTLELLSQLNLQPHVPTFLCRAPALTP